MAGWLCLTVCLAPARWGMLGFPAERRWSPESTVERWEAQH